MQRNHHLLRLFTIWMAGKCPSTHPGANMAYGKGKKGKGKGKGNKVCKTDTGHRPVTPVESAAFAI